MNATTLGRKIREIREQAELTQAQLARRIGTTQSAVSRLESGRIDPSLRLLRRISQATGLPISIVLEPQRRLPSRAERLRRVRRVLGDYRFDPWERNPTKAEARTLEADGLRRDRTKSETPSPASRART